MKITDIVSYFRRDKRMLTALNANADILIPKANKATAIHPGNAMRVATVYTCVSIRRDAVGMLPLHLFEEDSNGNKNIAKDHPAYNLIHKRPNGWQTPTQFWGMVSQYIDLHGECFVLISRNKNKPVSFDIITDPVDVKANKLNQPIYKIGERIINYYDMLHFKEYSNDGKRGISKITEHRETIGSAKQQREYSNRALDVTPPFYLTSPNNVTIKDEGIKSIKNKLKDQSSEYLIEGSLPVLTNGLEIKTVGLKPVDAAYLEQINATKEDIYGIFRIPPAIGGSYRTGVTYNNLEQQNLQFLIYTLSPLLKNIEEEVTEKLFPTSNHFVKFNTNALLRSDIKSRADWYSQMFKIGVYTQNEIRELENLNKFEGGDTRYIEGNNMVSI